MKKIIIASASIMLSAAAFIGYKVNDDAVLLKQNSILLQNVEALTQGELGPGDCSTECGWESCGLIYINGTAFYLAYCG